jgi:hypothetical protein
MRNGTIDNISGYHFIFLLTPAQSATAYTWICPSVRMQGVHVCQLMEAGSYSRRDIVVKV